MLNAATAYWPGQRWRTAQPESQGLDSQVLASAIDQVLQKHLGVHSLLVLRHGYVVLDAYFYPYNAATPHDVASVTKSITSALTGIAVDRGLIKTDQLLLSFFPKERPADPDEQKQRITIGDVLRMESGLDCGYAPGELELEQMKRSANWVQFALALPMKYPPGTHSSYCSPGYHLLGSVIATAAHQSELEFGRKFLFGPLGIREGPWTDDHQGRDHGWGDNHFTRDTARSAIFTCTAASGMGNRWCRATGSRRPPHRRPPRAAFPGAWREWHASNDQMAVSWWHRTRRPGLIVWPIWT
jgi:CubicO group peptidase (beta-lactamase class C family)